MFRFLFRVYSRSPAPLRRLAVVLSPIVRVLARAFGHTVKAGAYDMVLDPRDNATFRYLRHGRDYERETIGMLRDVVRANGPAVFVDVGAGYGFYSLALADLASPAGLVHIHAFEPDPRCIGAFRRSVVRNGLGSLITVNQAIVGEQSGTATLLFSDRASTSNRTFASSGPSFRSTKTLSVASVSLSDYMGPSTLDGLTFVMKVDVEGNELRVFRGLETMLRRCRAYCIQFEFYPVGMREVGQDRGRLVECLRSFAPDWVYVEGQTGMQRLDGLDGLVADMSRHADVPDSRGIGTAANYIIGRGVPVPA